MHVPPGRVKLLIFYCAWEIAGLILESSLYIKDIVMIKKVINF